MTSLREIMESKGKAPYDKSIKAQVVFTNEAQPYTNKIGVVKYSKTVAIADASIAVKTICYDASKFNKLVVGATIMLRNIIKLDRSVIITKLSKIFPTQDLSVPASRTKEGEALVSPPRIAELPLKEALSSPTKTSVRGKVVQVDEERVVPVRGTPTKLREIFLKDDSMERVKLTLWRNTCKEIKTGDYVRVSDVTNNTYKNETSLNTSDSSKVTKLEDQPVSSKLTVVGASRTETEHAELLLIDDSVRSVPSELLLGALPAGSMDIEAFFAKKGPIEVEVVKKGAVVCSIKLSL